MNLLARARTGGAEASVTKTDVVGDGIHGDPLSGEDS
jgi:hypothetical protein